MLSKFHESLFNMHSFLEKNMLKGLFFIASMQPLKYLKAFFIKRDFIRYYYFINICIIYQNRDSMFFKFVFFRFSVSPNFIFFYSFLYMLSIMFIVFLIYNFTFFLFKLELAVNLQLQNCS